jgi:hypothetical protein
MSAFLRVAVAVLALAAGQAGLAQPAAERVDKLSREYSFDASMQQAPAPAPAAATGDESLRFHEYRMQQQKDKLWFAAILGTVALLANIIVLSFLRQYKQSAPYVVSATGLVYIVFGTIILVVIANTEAQLTASMGVLGAIAGYLFGRLKRDEPEEEATGAKPPRGGGSQAPGPGP